MVIQQHFINSVLRLLRCEMFDLDLVGENEKQQILPMGL